jgi:hypothetical protein
MIVALTVLFAEVAAVLSCYAFDIFGLFGNARRQRRPKVLLLPVVMVGVIIAFGLHDPRPLICRLEQSRRSPFWLVLNAAGALIFVSPYLLLAAGIPISFFAPFSPICSLSAFCLRASASFSGCLTGSNSRER